MVGTQNETDKFGARHPECGISRTYSAITRPHSAFTLTELLVVITIIAILASLVTGAALIAMKRAKQAAITLELQQLGGALEDVKNEYGAYPPNCISVNANVNANTLAANDVVRMFKKAFPRSQEPVELIYALAAKPNASAGGTYNVNLPRDNAAANIGGGLTGSEALVFWLGGFSSDVAFPISGPGGPSFGDGPDSNSTTESSDEVLEDRNLRYEFDLGRLGPRNADGTFDDSPEKGRFITYNDPRPGAASNAIRRINLWTYTPTGSNVPIAYYDTSRHSPAEYDLPVFGSNATGDFANVYALKQLREGVTTATNKDDVIFVENKKFQILHCGIDDIWGDSFLNFRYDNTASMPWNNIILAPEGPFIGDVADTLGNFMAGTLEDKQE